MTNFPSGGVHIQGMGFSVSIHKPMWTTGKSYAASIRKKLHMGCCFCFQFCDLRKASCSIWTKPSKLTWKKESNTFTSPKMLALSCSAPTYTCVTISLRRPCLFHDPARGQHFLGGLKNKTKKQNKMQKKRWVVDFFGFFSTRW